MAYHNTTIRPAVLEAVERAKKFYGDIKIIATGHSMGGAMAAFCGLDLTVTITCLSFCGKSMCILQLTAMHKFDKYFLTWIKDVVREVPFELKRLILFRRHH